VHADDAVRVGDNYAGRGVHTAARIGAVAGAGEIVASATTVEAMPGLSVADRRSVELKGLVEPVEVVSVEWREGA
jgi:class 3 adenylate cyclase